MVVGVSNEVVDEVYGGVCVGRRALGVCFEGAVLVRWDVAGKGKIGSDLLEDSLHFSVEFFNVDSIAHGCGIQKVSTSLCGIEEMRSREMDWDG